MSAGRRICSVAISTPIADDTVDLNAQQGIPVRIKNTSNIAQKAAQHCPKVLEWTWPVFRSLSVDRVYVNKFIT